jgi:hypothetical protein
VVPLASHLSFFAPPFLSHDKCHCVTSVESALASADHEVLVLCSSCVHGKVLTNRSSGAKHAVQAWPRCLYGVFPLPLPTLNNTRRVGDRTLSDLYLSALNVGRGKVRWISKAERIRTRSIGSLADTCYSSSEDGLSATIW